MRKLWGNKWFRSDWAVAALIALITFIVLSCVLVFHRTTFQTNLDNVNQYYTWYQKLATSVHHGYLPIWNNNINGGESFAGEIQTGVFYPVNIIFVWLFGSAHGISQQAIDYLVALHFAIAAFGLYLLAKVLGARRWPSILAGLTFALSGAVAFRAISQISIFYGLCLLPYPVYFLARFHKDETGRQKWLIFAGAMLGLTLLSGHIQPFYHSAVTLLMLELALVVRAYTGRSELWRSSLKRLKNLAIIFLTAMVVMLPQLTISAHYLSHAYRIEASGFAAPGEKISYAAFSKAFNLDFHEFFGNMVDPISYPVRDGNNIFIGLAPLTVIILAITVARRRFFATAFWRDNRLFIGLVFWFSVLAMLGYSTWFAVVLYKLPFVYEVRQLGRYGILFDLSLALVLAGSLDVVNELRLSARQRLYALGGGFFLAINGVYLFLLRHHIFSTHHALQVELAGLTLLGLAIVSDRKWRMVGLSTAIIATLFVNTLWYLPKLKPSIEVPSEYNLPAKLVNLLQSTNGKYRVEIVDNSIPGNVGNVYDVQTVAGYSATIYDNYYRFWRTPGISDQLVSDTLGIKYIVTKNKAWGTNPVYADDGRLVYAFDKGTELPKAFVTNKAGSTARSDYSGLNVQTLSYNDNQEKFSLKTTRAEQVIFSEAYYPGWVAKVDNKKVSIQPYAIKGIDMFRSLRLPAGQHTVEFDYQPFGITN